MAPAEAERVLQEGERPKGCVSNRGFTMVGCEQVKALYVGRSHLL